MLRFGVALAFLTALCAQENYEIQVYPYETVAPKSTMLELHSNFTIQGSKELEDGVRPTNHQWHETVEITHASLSGSRLDSTFLPAPTAGTAGNGSAITSGRECGYHPPGNGRLASVS